MKTSTRKTRRRWSAAEKAEIVRAHEQREGTQVQFCRSRGLAVPTLHNWLRRSVASGEFVEVEVAGPQPKAGLATEAVIGLPGGFTVRVQAGSDVRWIGQLIGVLRCGA